jgi:hypothetical protein
MADQTDTFVREVQEEIRRERLAQLWDRFGVIAIGLAALLVVGVGGYKYAEYSSLQAREAAGKQFEAATQLASEGKAQEARQAFDALAKSAPAGYGTLSRLRTAGALAEANKPAEAVAAYDAVAKDGSADVLLRDFAALQAALLRVDTADWTEMQNRLKDLIIDGNAWKSSALELRGLAAMKAGNEEEARKAFEQILADSAATPATAQRAQVMMTILTEASLAKAAASKGPATPPSEAAKPGASPGATPEKK